MNVIGKSVFQISIVPANSPRFRLIVDKSATQGDGFYRVELTVITEKATHTAVLHCGGHPRDFRDEITKIKLFHLRDKFLAGRPNREKDNQLLLVHCMNIRTAFSQNIKMTRNGQGVCYGQI